MYCKYMYNIIARSANPSYKYKYEKEERNETSSFSPPRKDRPIGESHGGRVIFESAERTRLDLSSTCGRSVCPPPLEATRPPPAKLQHLRPVLLSPDASPKETATTSNGWRGNDATIVKSATDSFDLLRSIEGGKKVRSLSRIRFESFEFGFWMGCWINGKLLITFFFENNFRNYWKNNNKRLTPCNLFREINGSIGRAFSPEKKL